MILRGLPAAGKSTFARELVKKEPNWVRINKDDLRAMMHDSEWSDENEKSIIKARNALIISALVAGKNVIVDDTNFASIHEEKISEIASDFDAEVEVKYFDTPLHVCIDRDQAREKSVGKKVIRDMWLKYCKPPAYRPPEGSDLETCVIVDIDGTIAWNWGHRSFYDYTKVLADQPIEPVITIVRSMAAAGHRVVIVSGRKDSCREDTITWLGQNNIPCDALLMRKADDDRDDTIVKKEIFNTYIRDKWLPIVVFDDRDKVVDMWRSLGLKCLQCEYGNF